MPSDSNKHKANSDSSVLPQNYEVTSQGSLGLLALGAVGIKAWRKKRKEEEEEKPIATHTGNE
jgi:hypothetical protein